MLIHQQPDIKGSNGEKVIGVIMVLSRKFSKHTNKQIFSTNSLMQLDFYLEFI